ncbi:MAG: error-prone DNA polymerase, partial [Acidobacteriota bacterium]
MSYIELHASSAFSFLEASSLPEELAQEAARLDYPALALLDRDGVYGAPRFYKACRQAGLRPIVGAKITLQGDSSQFTSQLPLLVENRTGYQNLCRLITRMKLRSEKGKGTVHLDELEEFASGLICLTGDAQGPLRSALEKSNLQGALLCLQRLHDIYGPDGVYIELQRHFDRHQEAANQALIELGQRLDLPLMASNGVRYAKPGGRPLLDGLTSIRHKTTLEKAGRLLNSNAECHLKAAREMERLFRDLPEALGHTEQLSQRVNFTLEDLGYRFPEYPVPGGGSMIGYLCKLVDEGARRHYRPYSRRARKQIERELALIGKLNLAGYFLIVWDIVRFCREQDILVQGRGSAANSAVCYSLGITAVDPVGMDLLFERFLSEEREEWPDIDLDLPSGSRRERVLQYVYDRYGQQGAAMTATVITYRGRSAVREVGKILALPAEILDRLSRLMNSWTVEGFREELPARFKEAGLDLSDSLIHNFLKLWVEIQDLPRHLGQHTGGMVISQGHLDSVVPLENASMKGRRVVQWDKEDCADLGIVKVDLLGLGMMAALQDSLYLIHHSGSQLDLAHLPPDDPEVYALLQKADTVGVFQVESRAQMATLPRLQPRCFYDLVVEIAIIRPGPIVGQMVHPYLKRRSGQEPVTYPHPSLEPILKRTLGVPLFQEQLLRIAMVAAGFTGGEAEELRRALGFKRSEARMKEIELKLRQGFQQTGITRQAAETIIRYITSFALYGFPESHSASFALLTYASAYIKTHFPAAFYASLLNNQPMGFYHPATLVKDAQRRNQRIKPIDILRSNWLCTLEDESIRLGLMYVSGLREKKGKKIEQERHQKPFHSLNDLRLRTGLRKVEMKVLAEIGALNGFGMRRRQALWQVEAICRPGGPLLAELEVSQKESESPLRDMTAQERLLADYGGTGVTIGPHPMALQRQQLNARGVRIASQLPRMPDGERVRVAGGVIARQRPQTARGFFFMSLEDESGIANIVVQPKLLEKNRLLLLTEPFLMVEGILQNQNHVTSVKAQSFQALSGIDIDLWSRDF